MQALLEDVVSVLPGLLAQSAKASLLACTALIVCLTCRRWISPGWRHALWCLVFVRLILPDLPVPGWSMNRLLPQQASLTGKPALADGATGTPAVTVPESLSRASVQSAEVRAASSDSMAAPLAGEVGTKQNPEISSWSWSAIPGVVWFGGVALWWSGLLICWMNFRLRVLRRATAADAVAQEAMEECRNLAGIRSRVRLLCSERMQTPCVCGVIRPVILIPRSLAGAMTTGEFRLLLLHELGHVKRRDTAIQLFASMLLGLHWWNPVLWFAWRQLRDEAETATDAWVLRRTGRDAAASYGEMLLGLVAKALPTGLAVLWLPSLIGASSRARSLRARLAEMAPTKAMTRRPAMVGAAVVVLLSVVSLAEDKPKTNEGAPAGSVIGGVVVNESGEPISGAEVQVLFSANKGRLGKSLLPPDIQDPAPVQTDSAGRWRVGGVPAGLVPFSTDASSEGREMYRFRVSHPEYLLREFSSGTSSLNIATAITDDDAAFRKLQGKLVLRRGLVLRGVVRDEAGQPISGATIERNLLSEKQHDPVAVTDAAGHYELKAARPGDLVMRVRAKGHAAFLQRVNLDAGADGMQDFTMESARTLRLKIVDENGRPLVSDPSAKNPRYRLNICPAEGEWKAGEYLWDSESGTEESAHVWDEAPAGKLKVRISATGYNAVTQVVTASGDEVVVKLPAGDRLPDIRITVTDAESGEPLPGCSIEVASQAKNASGWFFPLWSSGQTGPRVRPGAEPGTYVTQFPTGAQDREAVLCIRHDGYIPVMKDGIEYVSGQIPVSVAMKKGAPTPLKVTDAAGAPASGADVMVAWNFGFISLRDFRVPRGGLPLNQLEFVGKSDADGRCEIPACSPDASLIVLHPEGFATVPMADVKRNPTVRLGLYAVVEAQVTLKGQPVPGRPLVFGGSYELPGGRRLYQTINGTTDEQGRLVLPRVLPCRGSFREPAPTATEGGSRTLVSSFLRSKNVLVGAITKYELELGSTGSTVRWTVTGRIVSPKGVPLVGNERLLMLGVNRVTPEGNSAPAGIIHLEEGGRFTIEGLGMGNYAIAALPTSSAPKQISFGGGRTSYEFSLPDVAPDAAAGAKTQYALGDIEVVPAAK